MDISLLLLLTALVAISAIKYEEQLSTWNDWEPYPDEPEIDYSGDDEQTALLCCQS